MSHTAILHAGIAAARADDKPLAREHLRKFLESEPRNEVAWLWLASIAETSDERLACVERALEINPRSERANEWLAPLRGACAQEALTRGVASAKAGDAEAARIELLRATELDPRKELAWLWLASLAVAPLEKLAHLERVLAVNPANGHALSGVRAARTQLAQTLIAQAANLVRGGEPDAARERLREAVAHDAEIEDAWLLLARVTDDAEERRGHLHRALAVAPASSRARQALDDLETHLALPVAAVWACPLCGEASRDGAMSPTACGACGAQLDLEDTEAFFNHRGDSNETLLRQATARLRRSFETSDATAEDCRNLGCALLNLGETAEGIEYLRTALRIDPQDESLARAIKSLVTQEERQTHERRAQEDQAREQQAREQQAHEQAELETLSVQHEREQAASEQNAAQQDAAVEQAPPQASVPVSVPTTFAAARTTTRTVMIVDDSPTVRKLVTIKLERQGHRVIEAADGMEALARLNEEVPDLILSDITMPRMDGYQLCKLVKSNSATRHVPVVMLSGKDGFFDKMKGKLAGSTAYLTKPFEPETLLRIVAEHCATAAPAANAPLD